MKATRNSQLATRNSLLRLVAGLLLVGGLFGGGAQATPARQVPAFGSVQALALDANGDGWAWAGPHGPDYNTNFLLRIEGGAYRVAASTAGNPTLLPPRLEMARIALTADGKNGWAVGNIPDDAGGLPLLWRFQNGEWRVARTSFPDGLRLLDLTISADGSDGWIATEQFSTSTRRLLRLRNGAWDYVSGAASASIDHIAISPNGQHGWASGRSSQAPTALLYQWKNGQWTQAATPPPHPAAQMAVALVADDAGNGWMTTEPTANRQPTGEIVRLHADQAPVVVALDPAANRIRRASFRG